MSLNATNLYIQASQIPVTFKGSPNDLFTEMIKRMRILSPSGTNFIFIGDTEPTSNVGPWLKNGTQWYVWSPATKNYVPVDISPSFTPAFSIGNSFPLTQDPPLWMRTTKDAVDPNAPDYGEIIRLFMYDFTRGQWLATNPVAPGGNEVRMWKGTEGALWAYDGGDGSDPAGAPPTDTTGAMWEVDHAFDFRIPVGPGTNSVTYGTDPASVINVGNTGGEEKHLLALTEQGASYIIASIYSASVPVGANGLAIQNLAMNGVQFNAGAPGQGGNQSVPVVTNAALGAHENMPPYVGVFFIKRTARKFYTP